MAEEKRSKEVREEREQLVTCHRDDTLNQVNSLTHVHSKDNITQRDKGYFKANSGSAVGLLKSKALVNSENDKSKKRNSPRLARQSPLKGHLKQGNEARSNSRKRASSMDRGDNCLGTPPSKKFFDSPSNKHMNGLSLHGAHAARQSKLRTSPRLKTASRPSMAEIDDYSSMSDDELAHEAKGAKAGAACLRRASNENEANMERRRSQRNSAVNLSPYIDYYEGRVRSPPKSRPSLASGDKKTTLNR